MSHATALRMLPLLPIAAIAAGCESEPSAPDADAAPVSASANPTRLFEGLDRIAVEFSGADFSGVAGPPEIEATGGRLPGPGDIEITDWSCNRVRCGVAFRLGKWLETHGQPLPPPIRGQQLRVTFRKDDGSAVASTLLVLPLDRGGSTSVTSPPALSGTYLFSSFQLGPGVVMRAEASASGLPARLFVTGDIAFGEGAGLVASGGPGAAVPPAGGSPGPSGTGGGASGSDGAGTYGGRAGVSADQGGGGGGFGTAGEEGGTPAGAGGGGAGGVQGGSAELECLRANTAPCGGAGGGSAGSGEGGGGGGGAAVVVSLGTLRAANAVFRSAGGDGAGGVSGGGGGAGGAIGVGASRVEGTLGIEAPGGAGGPAGTGGVGGSGGGGRVREDRVGGTIAVEAGSAYRGAAVDVSALDVVVPDAEIPLAGTGRPGAAVIVRNYSVTPAARTEGVVGADGTFAVRVPLQPGLNDLEVAQRDGAIEARSWIGTIFELSGTTVLGARIYVVRVPEVE